MSVFDHYAKYYDLLYKDKDYVSEAKFILALLSERGVTSGSLLELGSGTGKHAFEFAQAGFTVDGYDLSPDMVATANRLKQETSSQISFGVGDVRTLRTGQKYEVVASLFHVVSYQQSNDDVLAMFATAAEHLHGGQIGGLFIFDCWYGPAVLTDPPHVRTKRLGDEAIDVMRIAEPKMHPNENLVDVNYTVLIKDRSEKTVEEIRETHTMRYFFRPEIELMLRQSGLKLVSDRESFSGNPLGLNTWNSTFVAQKI